MWKVKADFKFLPLKYSSIHALISRLLYPFCSFFHESLHSNVKTVPYLCLLVKVRDGDRNRAQVTVRWKNLGVFQAAISANRERYRYDVVFFLVVESIWCNSTSERRIEPSWLCQFGFRCCEVALADSTSPETWSRQ